MTFTAAITVKLKDLHAVTLIEEDSNTFSFSLFFFPFVDNAIEAIDEFAFLEGNVIFFKYNYLHLIKFECNYMVYCSLYKFNICAFIHLLQGH